MRALICILILFMLGCEPTTEEKRKEYAHLNAQVTALKVQLAQEQQLLAQAIQKESAANENARLLGRDPTELLRKHTVTFRVSQSSFSLSLTEHLKNDMNATEFTIPVSKDYYDAVNVGDHVSDDFRMGSFILRGKVGSMTVRITAKETH